VFKRLKETPRVNARFEPAGWRHREAVLLPYPAGVVWGLVQPAENSVFLTADCARSWHVEGTPVHAVGEQQAFEALDGSVSVIEVTEYEHERRSIARVVQPQLRGMTGESITETESRGNGCVFAITYQWTLPPGSAMPSDAAGQICAHAKDYVRRVTESIGPWVASRA
jgi:hypothetical protein